MLCSTIRDILTGTEAKYGAEDAVRYKVKKNEIASKTYSELKRDSESFSAALKELGEQGNHIAVIGRTSYEWLVSYFGIVDGGSVAVPLDASLPAADLCELLDRADVTVLVFDEVRSDAAEILRFGELLLRVGLTGDEHVFFVCVRALDRRKRQPAPHVERDRRIGKDDLRAHGDDG